MKRVSPRGKIVLGGIIALVAIAGLHLAIFDANAAQYEQAVQQFRETRQEYNNLGSPKNMQEIYEFQYQTINYEMDFFRLVEDANLEYSPGFDQGWADEAGRIDVLEEQVLILWDQLDQLQQMSNTLDVNLSFLTSQNGWYILEELPEEVQATGTALSDMMRDLADTDALLKAMRPEGEDDEQRNQQQQQQQQMNPMMGMFGQQQQQQNSQQQQYQRFVDQYEDQLSQVGLNLSNRDAAENQLGIVWSILFTLNRIELVKDVVDRTELGAITTDEDYNSKLFDLFRMEWGDGETLMYNGFKQLKALMDLIEIAEENEVSEIRSVRLWETRELTWPPREDQEEEEGADQTGMGMGMGFDPMMMGMMGMDPDAMDEFGGDPYMMMMMGMGDPSMMGTMDGAPEEEKEVPAYYVPIEMDLVGSNRAIMSFLYEITNNRRAYAVDSVQIAAQPTAENQIIVRVVIKVVSYYAEFTPTPADVEDNILRLLNEKKLIATRVGAQELAAEEGFLDRIDEIPPYEGDLPLRVRPSGGGSPGGPAGAALPGGDPLGGGVPGMPPGAM